MSLPSLDASSSADPQDITKGVNPWSRHPDHLELRPPPIDASSRLLELANLELDEIEHEYRSQFVGFQPRDQSPRILAQFVRRGVHLAEQIAQHGRDDTRWAAICERANNYVKTAKRRAFEAKYDALCFQAKRLWVLYHHRFVGHPLRHCKITLLNNMIDEAANINKEIIGMMLESIFFRPYDLDWVERTAAFTEKRTEFLAFYKTITPLKQVRCLERLFAGEMDVYESRIARKNELVVRPELIEAIQRNLRYIFDRFTEIESKTTSGELAVIARSNLEKIGHAYLRIEEKLDRVQEAHHSQAPESRLKHLETEINTIVAQANVVANDGALPPAAHYLDLYERMFEVESQLRTLDHFESSGRAAALLPTTSGYLDALEIKTHAARDGQTGQGASVMAFS